MTLATIPDRITALRTAMHEHGVAACIVPTADPHASEYLPEHWTARAWLSGFTGSAGTLVITADFAGLWTDSRYFGQAERQLAGSGVKLEKLRVPHTAEHLEWLLDHVVAGDTVAIAGDSVPTAAAHALARDLDDLGARLRTDLDLPGAVWTDRPSLPHAPVMAHPPEYATTPRSEKLARVRAAMDEAGVTHHFISTLDDIAWITNLRGRDVGCNPVFLAHLLLGPDGATLFADADRFDPKLLTALADDGVRVADYAAVRDQLAALPAGFSVLFDPQHVVVALVDVIPESVDLIAGPNPSTPMKAVKSSAELAHIREAMRQDGAALVNAMSAIERDLGAGIAITELDIDTRLHAARAARPNFVEESFPTIAGYMANGAMPHYQATTESHSNVHADGLLLIDSGAQYLGGTTDITRVWAFGATTDEQRRDATLVLKGMIGLTRATFPAGASGPQLDALARAPLWAANADYGHGTGHGVGYFLNVHEGPHGIRPPAPGGAIVPLEVGMITSIEPGLYKPGRHGVRHENLAVVVAAGKSEFGEFRAFETITLCPIDTRALNPALLDPAERDWLNTYHARCETELSPLVTGDARTWLHARCAAI